MAFRLLKLLISTFLWTIDSMRIVILKVLGRKPFGNCVILYYHNVAPEQRVSFAHQMDTLRRLTRPISIEDEIELDGHTQYSAITFDDGFLPAFENAVPELQKEGIPFTFFIPSGHLGGEADWGEYGFKDPYRTYGDKRIISPEQLRILAGSNLATIGSHSASHVDLTSLDKNAAIQEMRLSKLALHGISDRNIHTLSFPYGGFGDREIALARQLGYKRVFSTLPVPNRFSKNDFLFGRVGVDAADWRWEFRLKALGCYRWLPVAFRLKKGLKALLKNDILKATVKKITGNNPVSKMPAGQSDKT